MPTDVHRKNTPLQGPLLLARRVVRRGLMLPLIAVMLAMAACGGDEPDDTVGVATPTDSESSSNDPSAVSSPDAAGSAGSGVAAASGLTQADREATVATAASQSSSSGGEDVPEGLAGENAAPVALSDEEMLLEFSACMRENGLVDFELPDFDDLVFDADGNLQISQMLAGSGLQLNSEEFRRAFEACSQHIEGTTLGQAAGGFNVSDLQDSLLAFARCMRLEGIEVEDPKLSKLVVGLEADIARRLFGKAFDLTDPTVQDAVSACIGKLGGLAGAAVALAAGR